MPPRRCYDSRVSKQAPVSSTAPAVRRVIIGAEQAGQRIDNFLQRELKGLPKTRVYRLLRKGEVRVNRGRVDATYRLQDGDEVRIPPVRLADPQAPVPAPDHLLQRLTAAAVYEDERLLVLDKPSGMAVHGGSGIRHGVIELLRAQRPQAKFLELVHRLDRDTSGLLLIAKKRSALRELHEMLREGRIHKNYLTLLAGRLPRGTVPVEAALDRHNVQGGERVVKVASSGKHSRTLFRAVERYGEATLTEAQIHTGRTHQIRVHAAHIGHPVLGDDKYGDAELNRRFKALGLKRLFLHAHKLELDWGDERAPLVLSAPLPPELRSHIDQLERPRQPIR